MKPECMLDSWYRELDFMFKSSQYHQLVSNLKNEKAICPKPKDVFKAFSYFDFSDTRIVMVFLSPYQTQRPDHRLYATGLATGVSDITHLDKGKSIVLLEKALRNDYPDEFSEFDVTLEGWAKQGVLLLNPALTVPLNGDPKAHLAMWTPFTKIILQVISSRLSGVIFVPFGAVARDFCKVVNKANHYILDNPSIPHPAAYSYSVKSVGEGNVPLHLDITQSRVFKRIDELTKHINKDTIDWYK